MRGDEILKHEIYKNDGEHPLEKSIREVCEAFDVTPRTLRHYEAVGLIEPRRDGQKRLYRPREIGRLKLILRGKRFGFRLEEIRELLDLYDADPTQLSQLTRALDLAREKLDILKRQRIDLDAAIDELQDQMKLVARLIETRSASAAGGRGDAQNSDDDAA